MDFVFFSKRPFAWAENKLVEEISKLGYKAEVWDWDQVEVVAAPFEFFYQGIKRELPKVAMFESRIRSRYTLGDRLYLFDALELLEQQGMTILNSPQAVRKASNKVYAANVLQRAGIRVPSTRMVSSVDQVGSCLKEWKDIILKPLSGHASIDIKRLILNEFRYGDEIADVLSIFQEIEVWHLIQNYKVLCAQQYVSNPGYDLRINVVGDKVVSIWALDCLPNTWRTKDINEGKKLRKYELTKELEDIALSAVSALGLDYAPIDLIEGPDGPIIIEVNSALSIWPGHEKSGFTIDPEGSVKFYVQMIEDRIKS